MRDFSMFCHISPVYIQYVPECCRYFPGNEKISPINSCNHWFCRWWVHAIE